MDYEQLKSKIEEQQAIYHALKAGDTGTVCYKEFQNGEWGTDDENYVNRLRLAYYFLHCHIEDEEAVVQGYSEAVPPDPTFSGGQYDLRRQLFYGLQDRNGCLIKDEIRKADNIQNF